MSFKINQVDLEFVLKQIKIAETNADGISLIAILLDVSGAIADSISEFCANKIPHHS